MLFRWKLLGLYKLIHDDNVALGFALMAPNLLPTDRYDATISVQLYDWWIGPPCDHWRSSYNQLIQLAYHLCLLNGISLLTNETIVNHWGPMPCELLIVFPTFLRFWRLLDSGYIHQMHSFLIDNRCFVGALNLLPWAHPIHFSVTFVRMFATSSFIVMACTFDHDLLGLGQFSVTSCHMVINNLSLQQTMSWKLV